MYTRCLFMGSFVVALLFAPPAFALGESCGCHAGEACICGENCECEGCHCDSACNCDAQCDCEIGDDEVCLCSFQDEDCGCESTACDCASH